MVFDAAAWSSCVTWRSVDGEVHSGLCQQRDSKASAAVEEFGCYWKALVRIDKVDEVRWWEMRSLL